MFGLEPATSYYVERMSKKEKFFTTYVCLPSFNAWTNPGKKRWWQFMSLMTRLDGCWLNSISTLVHTGRQRKPVLFGAQKQQWYLKTRQNVCLCVWKRKTNKSTEKRLKESPLCKSRSLSPSKSAESLALNYWWTVSSSM